MRHPLWVSHLLHALEKGKYSTELWDCPGSIRGRRCKVRIIKEKLENPADGTENFTGMTKI
ncbi:hypothetical protein Q4610_11080 [Sphingobium sp. HBC34]|uniref:Uncharacterized protein n=1 Tax=Sphingobium cyanobacteriorum TaxID=3063954 RepID=A0ABT8ZQ05_9SPHN|nr:hypothetical protein [Sphingobium sp. HBC34]MDO7835586.1 hypothetical protein [Sphingobium sp. HBC34]